MGGVDSHMTRPHSNSLVHLKSLLLDSSSSVRLQSSGGSSASCSNISQVPIDQQGVEQERYQPTCALVKGCDMSPCVMRIALVSVSVSPIGPRLHTK